MRFASIRLLVLMWGSIGLLSIGGCGNGDKSCSDTCKAIFACADKRGEAPSHYLGEHYDTEANCIERCKSTNCTGKQETLNCVGDLECSKDISLTMVLVTGCVRFYGCSSLE
jgi:hypothetical protein